MTNLEAAPPAWLDINRIIVQHHHRHPMSDMATPAASAATTLRSAKRALRKSMATALQAISREQVLKECELPCLGCYSTGWS